MDTQRRGLLLAGGALALAPASRAVANEPWPSKPIRLVIGYATGGSTDATARLVGRRLEQRLGQPIVYEYKPGAGASLGADFVAKSAADGYTIGLTDTGPMAVFPNLRKLAYDPTRDFTPLSYVCATGLAVIVHPSVAARTIPELVALCRASPGTYNYASSGVGSVHHMAGELFKSMARVELNHVAYRGAGPALTDLVGGTVPVMFATIGPALPMIASGKARALGVTTAARSRALPDVPTVAEQGLPGYEAVLSFTLVGPPKMPAPVVARLQRELQAALADPALVADLEKQGNDGIGARPPEVLPELIADELAKWGRVIRDAKITLDS
ncbi:MAG TPA: tripartite tricarboxylate transporter substrate binding protein [Burkholderiaceae bacterium]|nr:tripartite tricarboxylate transporter substrate binding protein [Burkholderiaceae bacterium]